MAGAHPAGPRCRDDRLSGRQNLRRRTGRPRTAASGLSGDGVTSWPTRRGGSSRPAVGRTDPRARLRPGPIRADGKVRGMGPHGRPGGEDCPPAMPVETACRPGGAEGFVPLPRHRVVDRTPARPGRCRRHGRDRERQPCGGAAPIESGVTGLVPHRLAPDDRRPPFRHRLAAWPPSRMDLQRRTRHLRRASSGGRNDSRRRPAFTFLAAVASATLGPRCRFFVRLLARLARDLMPPAGVDPSIAPVAAGRSGGARETASSGPRGPAAAADGEFAVLGRDPVERAERLAAAAAGGSRHGLRSAEAGPPAGGLALRAVAADFGVGGVCRLGARQDAACVGGRGWLAAQSAVQRQGRPQHRLVHPAGQPHRVAAGAAQQVGGEAVGLDGSGHPERGGSRSRRSTSWTPAALR